MTDDWEDWENEDYIIPILNVPNEEQLKKLEENKLVEESDNALTRDLFSNPQEKDLTKQFEQKINTISSEKKISKKYVSSKQKENEEKQKELSKKIKEEKLKKQRKKEIFGEADEDNEYTKYEDMFY
jgi:ribonuclease D